MDIQTHLRKANQDQKRVAQIIIMVICVECYGRRDANGDADDDDKSYYHEPICP